MNETERMLVDEIEKNRALAEEVRQLREVAAVSPRLAAEVACEEMKRQLGFGYIPGADDLEPAIRTALNRLERKG